MKFINRFAAAPLALAAFAMSFTAAAPATSAATSKAEESVSISSAVAPRPGANAAVRLRARVVEVAAEQPNYAGVKWIKDQRVVSAVQINGVGKPTPQLRQVLRKARANRYVKVTWEQVPHTRLELRIDAAQAIADPRIEGVMIDGEGRWITVHSCDLDLFDTSRPPKGVREKLGLTVRVKLTSPPACSPTPD